MSHEMECGASTEQTEEVTAEKPNLVLIGFMAVGKSKIGPMCARRLGYEFWDSDIEIERQTGCSVAELFAREGEAAFRERERQVVAELAARRGAVISTGGGTVLNPENAARLRETGLVVLLTAPAHVIFIPARRYAQASPAGKRPQPAGANSGLAFTANPLL